MNILNIMLGQKSGGLEQAAIDYHEALDLVGFNVHSVVHSRAAVKTGLSSLSGNVHYCNPLGEWDLISAHYLKHLARMTNADLAICHGNRAIGLSLRSMQSIIPIVGVTHNYKVHKRFPKCDAVFCITNDLLETMKGLNFEEKNLFHIPNMVRKTSQREDGYRIDNRPLKIGSMGRFVPKKGFDVFLKSLAHLKSEGIKFEATLGGDGPENENLRGLSKSLGLENDVIFSGWVTDKKQFFDNIDLFVLPSYHEPFGIVLIEAMAAGVPCLSTDSEGPMEIIHNNYDGLIVQKSNPLELAQAIISISKNPIRLKEIGCAGSQTVNNRYNIGVIGEKLRKAILLILGHSEHKYEKGSTSQAEEKMLKAMGT